MFAEFLRLGRCKRVLNFWMPQNPTKWAFTCKLRPWHSRGRAFRRFYEWKTLGGTKLQCRGMWTCRANCVETLRDVGFMSVQLRFGIAKQFLTSHKGVAFSVTSCPCFQQPAPVFGAATFWMSSYFFIFEDPTFCMMSSASAEACQR